MELQDTLQGKEFSFFPLTADRKRRFSHWHRIFELISEVQVQRSHIYSEGAELQIISHRSCYVCSGVCHNNCSLRALPPLPAPLGRAAGVLGCYPPLPNCSEGTEINMMLPLEKGVFKHLVQAAAAQSGPVSCLCNDIKQSKIHIFFKKNKTKQTYLLRIE